MAQSLTIDHSTPLPALFLKKTGKYGVIIAHGEWSKMDSGFLAMLATKLAEKEISSIRFSFPFRVLGKKYDKDQHSLDEAFITVYRQMIRTYPDIQWVILGHGIGAASCVRIAPIVDEFGDLPPIICLNYPLYPPNRPEKVDMRALGAIMGEALFCQGTESNRGDATRMRNAVRMMAEHVHVTSIKGANYELEVKGKDENKVAYWVSNDIQKFIEEVC
ncbi:MAG: hypothetical protein INQ03_21705 [Candidatus Heimdallarchaeota archaeon]|nr:hypothetical protein [Candidatus Heimdallarchaeota archaeon]